MKNFWAFYQNIDVRTIAHPFREFSPAHLLYVLATIAVVAWILRAYKKCGQLGKEKWLKGVGAFLFLQEIFYYGWIYVNCQTDPLFEVLHLELCTFCVFLDASCVFHKNKQVRFFGAIMGLIGAPIAIAYPATVTAIYPAFCYRIIGFYLSHGALVLFALLVLGDSALLTKKRLVNNVIIAAVMLILIYFFNLRFGTQYMFVGTPPEISIIRLVFDLTGRFFLPVAVVIYSAYQVMMYFVAKKIQRALYQ